MDSEWITFQGGPYDGLQVCFRGGPPVPCVMYVEADAPRVPGSSAGVFIACDDPDRVTRYELTGAGDEGFEQWRYLTDSELSRDISRLTGNADKRPLDVFRVPEEFGE